MVSHDAVAFWMLSREVARDRKVVQSGQGADEVFGGYYWYPPLLEAAATGSTSTRASSSTATTAACDELAAGWAPTGTSRARSRPLVRAPGAETPVDRGLRMDAEVMLVDDPVKRVDNMTMAHGLEARTPFLDHELVELAAACPPGLKLAEGGKGVLKAAARGVVPDAVIDRAKGYFPVPLLSHLEAPGAGAGARRAHAIARASAGCSGPRSSGHAGAPNEHRTNLDGASLWQLGLLELWLQAHGVG